jgi:hypothetical protein
MLAHRLLLVLISFSSLHLSILSKSWAQAVARCCGLRSVEKIHGLADRIANKAKDQQKKGLPNTTRVRGQVVKNVVDSVVVSVEAESI